MDLPHLFEPGGDRPSVAPLFGTGVRRRQLFRRPDGAATGSPWLGDMMSTWGEGSGGARQVVRPRHRRR
jgi:hypothetical protein